MMVMSKGGAALYDLEAALVNAVMGLHDIGLAEKTALLGLLNAWRATLAAEEDRAVAPSVDLLALLGDYRDAWAAARDNPNRRTSAAVNRAGRALQRGIISFQWAQALAVTGLELIDALDADPPPSNAAPWRESGTVTGPRHDMRPRIAKAWAAFLDAAKRAPR